MGQSSAETVREIEEVRGRLESNVRELERRIPEPARWAKRAVGIAVGGGVAAMILRSMLKRRRRSRKERHMVRPEVPRPVVQVVPEDVAERLAGAVGDGRWKPWAAGAAGLWVALRLVELRQLRRMNRALAGSGT